MPSAIKLANEYGDKGLHVLLVESQGHKRDEVVPFLIQAFPGAPAVQGVLGVNSPFQIPGKGIPKSAIVGVDGTIVWTSGESGSPEKILQQELARLHEPAKVPAALKSVTKDLAARSFGKAAAAARALAAKSADGSESKTDADALLEQIGKAVDRKLAQADRLLRAGRAARAKAMLATLAKQVAPDKELAARVAERLSALDSPANASALAADKLLVAAEDLLRERKGREAAGQKLDELLKKHPDAKVAPLAKELRAGLAAKDVLR